jgi:tetratricopeptide (TPR) repeat protein
MFNFPLERANMAMHMIVCAAAITAIHVRNNKSSLSDKYTGMHLPALGILATLGAVCCWISLEAYRSMAVQNKIAIEWFGNPREAKPPFSAAAINPLFPSIPNLNELGMPISCMKAKYLAQEGKYADALAELERGNRANPYLYYAEFLKTNMALAQNQRDTAFHYVKIAYYNRPANQQLFNLLCDIAYTLKDTAELSKAFTLKISTRPEESDFVKYATYLYALNNDLSVRKEIIEKGLKKYSESKVLTFEKYFGLGLEFAAKEMHDSAAVNYERAVAIQPNAFASKNAGVCYLQMKKYNEAIPHFTAAIASGQFTDGLPEYGRGACYYNMQRYDEACPDIRIAIQRGFPVEANVVARCTQ